MLNISARLTVFYVKISISTRKKFTGTMDISTVALCMGRKYELLCRQKGRYVSFICTRRASQGVNGGFLGLTRVVGCMMRQGYAR